MKRLQTLLKQVPMHGPVMKGRRQAVNKLIGYLKPRLKMMRYREWISQDLGYCQWSSGRSGAARRWRTDGSRRHGRWIPQRAEALLHLRRNPVERRLGYFISWTYQRYQGQLRNRQAVQIRTDEPMKLARAA